MKRTPYDSLTLMPYLAADTLCLMQYQGREITDAARSGDQIARTEALRKAMTPAARREFADLADKRCRAAYEARAAWFEKCVKGTQGRDQLYVWISHWLSAFLANPEQFRRNCALQDTGPQSA